MDRGEPSQRTRPTQLARWATSINILKAANIQPISLRTILQQTDQQTPSCNKFNSKTIECPLCKLGAILPELAGSNSNSNSASKEVVFNGLQVLQSSGKKVKIDKGMYHRCIQTSLRRSRHSFKRKAPPPKKHSCRTF